LTGITLTKEDTKYYPTTWQSYSLSKRKVLEWTTASTEDSPTKKCFLKLGAVGMFLVIYAGVLAFFLPFYVMGIYNQAKQ